MPNRPFTLRQLEVFGSLAATGSFKRSAEALGISQASVSSQMKSLEEQLGRRLLHRKPGRRPQLTADGIAFHEDLRAFEHAAEVLSAHRRRGGPGDEPVRYRLLVGQGMFDAYIRSKLDRFFAEHPLIELDFETRPPSNALVRSIDTGLFDFALIHQRENRNEDPALERLALVRGGIYGHRDFAEGRELPLEPDDIAELPFMMPEAGSPQEREALQNLAQAGIRPSKIVGHTPYYDVVAAMIERGVAVASFSEAILPDAARKNVVRLLPMVNWYLEFYRKRGLSGPQADAVERFLKTSVLEDPTYPSVEVFAR